MNTKKLFFALFLSLFLLAACAPQQVIQPLPAEETIIEPAVQEPTPPIPTEVRPDPSLRPAREFTIEGDDDGLYPSSITVNYEDKVRITFKARSSNVYYGGLDFRGGPWGDTGRIAPGDSKTVEFIAAETFQFKSYWPSSNRLKATGNVIVK